MKHIRIPLVFFFLVFMLFCLARCEKDRKPIPPVNITLWDKPLSVIQSYIKGKWMLQYAYGGLSTHKYFDLHNSYMILSPNHIVLGNDSLRVVVDTTILWVRTDIGSNDFTYLLSYSWSGYLWPEYYIVNQIKNDTLIIRDYENDGFDYYYTKY
jgi:hypothetical protein